MYYPVHGTRGRPVTGKGGRNGDTAGTSHHIINTRASRPLALHDGLISPLQRGKLAKLLFSRPESTLLAIARSGLRHQASHDDIALRPHEKRHGVAVHKALLAGRAHLKLSYRDPVSSSREDAMPISEVRLPKKAIPIACMMVVEI